MAQTEAMNVLNEIAGRYPDAISLAAGRPPDDLLPVERIHGWLAAYIRHHASLEGRSENSVAKALGQYSDTNGIILSHIARHLKVDEGLSIPPQACMITNGAQEAILICLLGLVGRDRAIAAADPTYVGLSGAAAALGAELVTVPSGPRFVDDLAQRLAERPAAARPVGAVYCIPDFGNPLGEVMALEDRRRLLALAETHDFHIIEDAAYRAYRYEGATLPSLKALDTHGRVALIISFAKTFMPGARTAVLVAETVDGSGRVLAERLAWLKSYVSVATSPITQAILAGHLLETQHSLRATIAPRVDYCRANRDLMIAALERHLGGVPGVSWSRPAGGFFLVLELPAPFSTLELERCAEAGVIVVPVSMFSADGRGVRQVRLAFSNVRPERIDEAIARLALFVRDELVPR